jgi:hypothetical protein
MSTKDTSLYIAPDLRDFEIYPKICELVQYIVDNFENDYSDIINKYQNPALASDDVISEVINEYGFGYINELIDTLENVDISILLNFMSLLHFLKGTRAGLELVLETLGFQAIIVEWWETNPKGPEHTFDMTVLMDLSKVPEVFVTLSKVRLFVEQYVYPKFNIADLVFSFEFAEAHTAHAGFHTQAFTSELIEGTI